MYEASKTIVIDHTNQYHAVTGLIATGNLSGWTFGAGSTGSGDITTSGGGSAININDVAHGLADGDYVTVSSSNHAGVAAVTRIDDDNFTLPITYVGDETCDWQQGSYLQAGINAEGVYSVSLTVIGESVGTNKKFKWEVALNDTLPDNVVLERDHGNTDLGNMGSGGIFIIAAGDRVWIAGKNKTDSTNFTIEHANLNVMRG
ncbi:MAG: hypothetical protein GY869_16925 [Planctomycetes bacterium]|nr:hypothetical protein [Planctomycetota bacterium]